MGQKFAAYNASGAITGFYDDIDSPVPEGIEAIEITDAEWQECLSTQSHTVVGGVLVAPAPPTTAELLAVAQTEQGAMVSAACQVEILAGFTSSALGDPHTYPSKATDQQNLTASILASLMPGNPSGWVTPFWCEDATGAWGFVNHTAVQIQQVGVDGKAAVLAAMAKNAALQAEVAAATTIEAVQAIIWTPAA